jgi:hypothetical protein
MRRLKDRMRLQLSSTNPLPGSKLRRDNERLWQA